MGLTNVFSVKHLSKVVSSVHRTQPVCSAKADTTSAGVIVLLAPTLVVKSATLPLLLTVLPAQGDIT